MNSPAVVRRWSDRDLDAARLDSIADFISRRGAESGDAYRNLFHEAYGHVAELFSATDDLRTLAGGRAFQASPSLLGAARYLGGPPISEDDLDTLAETRVAKANRLTPTTAEQAARVILAALDRERFPWLEPVPARVPTDAERQSAIRWTAGLWAVQRVQTGRRGEASARQEEAVKVILRDARYQQVSRRPINVVDDLDRGTFCPEAMVAGTKCDVPVRLLNGRLLLIECKVSGSQINSVKRLNRETGGKASRWRTAFGQQAVTAAVLAGVFRLGNLTGAQDNDGVTIFWERDLTPLAEFLEEAR